MLHNLESWHDDFKCDLFARAEQMLKKVSSLNHSNCQLSRFFMIEYLSLSTLNQLLAFETHLSHQNSMTTSETNKLINSMVSLFVMLKDKNESYDYKSFLNLLQPGFGAARIISICFWFTLRNRACSWELLMLLSYSTRRGDKMLQQTEKYWT